MTPTKHFDLTVRSVIIRSEKPNRGLEATMAPNAHQLNRIRGFLPDGTEAVIAHRPGKGGGMEFNKLLGGKIFAVAADAMSPVFEKDADGKPTRKQKLEDGLPYYTSSGFYTLSTKDYPALAMFEAFTRLTSRGEQVLIITQEQLDARQLVELASPFDWEMLSANLQALLGDENNLVSPFNVEANRRRKRDIEVAKLDAEEGEAYSGVEFKSLETSRKDGNAMVYFAWYAPDGAVHSGIIRRERESLSDKGVPFTSPITAEEALADFAETESGKALMAQLEAGSPVSFGFTMGHVMRTSVSFRKKVENFLNEPPSRITGDNVYIKGALAAWTPGLIALMHSMHPNFPQQDYDAHHYVAACRQAVIGMSRVDGRLVPEALAYNLAKVLLTEPAAVAA